MSDARKSPLKTRTETDKQELGFTGERIVPEADNCEPTFASRMYQEHIARYVFAGQLVKGISVIDVGCGVGYGSRRLADLGARSIYAFDISADAIRHASKYYSHSNISYDVGNAEKFKTAEKFDLAVCFELIEHVRNPRKVLENIKASLRPDGILIVSTPRALHEKRTHFHEHEFQLDEYASLLREYFPNLEMFVENNHFSSLITNACPTKLTRIECLKDQFQTAAADVFLAVATVSRSSLPAMDPVLILDDDAYVRTLERDVEILHKAENDLRERVEAIEEQRADELAFKDAEIERLTKEYQSLFGQTEALKSDLWEAQQRGAEAASKVEQSLAMLNAKEAQVARLTADCNALREQTSDLSNRLRESEMRNAEIQQEREKLRQELELMTVRSADADSRRGEAYEFARVASNQALALRREWEILRRDLAVALDHPTSISEETPTYDDRHRDIVTSMERLFLGTEATHEIARDPLVARIARLSVELRNMRDRNEQYAREIAALQEFQRHAEDWHRQLLRMRKSVSWRITAPLRGMTKSFRRSQSN